MERAARRGIDRTRHVARQHRASLCSFGSLPRIRYRDRGKKLLDNWDHLIARFVKVMPIEYKKVLERRRSTTRPHKLMVAGVANG